MRGRDRADAERHVLDESVRAMQLLRRVVVGDTVAYRCEVGLAGDEPELQALIPDEHHHRLHGQRIDRVREVVEHRIFQHRHRFLDIAEPTLGIAYGVADAVICRHLVLADLPKLRRYALA